MPTVGYSLVMYIQGWERARSDGRTFLKKRGDDDKKKGRAKKKLSLPDLGERCNGGGIHLSVD